MEDIFTKHFLCQIKSQDSLDRLEIVGESRYPGALPPVLETFRRAFSPDQNDFPSDSEDVTTENTSVSAGYADNGHLFLAQSTDSRFS